MLRKVISVCLFAVLAVFTSTSANAETFDRRTYFTFNQPVALPGVTLPPGKYMFRFVDTTSSRRVVHVMDAAGKKSYAMLMTLPNELNGIVPDRPEVRFGETRAGVPYALQAWWYPGDSIGREFIYPKHQSPKNAN